MRHPLALAPILCSFILVSAPLGAQERAGVMGELMRDAQTVEEKILGLARAMPQSAYDWRPGSSVRSAGEALGSSIEYEKVTTISGLVLLLLNRPAHAGDVVTWRNVRIEVASTAGRGVGEAVLSVMKPPAS